MSFPRLSALSDASTTLSGCDRHDLEMFEVSIAGSAIRSVSTHPGQSAWMRTPEP